MEVKPDPQQRKAGMNQRHKSKTQANQLDMCSETRRKEGAWRLRLYGQVPRLVYVAYIY